MYIYIYVYIYIHIYIYVCVSVCHFSCLHSVSLSLSRVRMTCPPLTSCQHARFQIHNDKIRFFSFTNAQEKDKVAPSLAISKCLEAVVLKIFAVSRWERRIVVDMYHIFTILVNPQNIAWESNIMALESVCVGRWISICVGS